MLKRRGKGPILKPTANWWECRAVFNCGAVYDGKYVHILYRAIGQDGISRLGYAKSKDGLTIASRPDRPVFESDPHNEFERLGCEDPRIAKIGSTFYITYTAASVYSAAAKEKVSGFSGCPWRVRVSLASTRDFRKFKRHGVILPDTDSKDAVLLPEKIKGRYVMYHRVYPHVWVSYSRDLLHWHGHKVVMKTRKGFWDDERIGAGATPIKTEKGWLHVYHGVDSKRHFYRLGIAIFDLNDPSKLIYRSEKPILEPQRKYELEGLVPNVVFSCGAVKKCNTLYVYYGGADKVIGVATMKMP